MVGEYIKVHLKHLLLSWLTCPLSAATAGARTTAGACTTAGAARPPLLSNMLYKYIAKMTIKT